MKAGKVVVSLVSLILLVGVIVGVVVVVHRNGKEDQSTRVQMKKVHEFCQPTEFKDACVRSLAEAAKNDSATEKDYLMAAFQTTAEAVKTGLEGTRNTSVSKDSDPYNHRAIEDCKLLLEFAIEDLESTLSVLEETDMNNINERGFDFLNWLSAIYAHQTTCVDAIDNPEYKSAMEKGLNNGTQLTNNALDIIAKLSSVFQSFNVGNLINSTGASNSAHRRLLEVNQVDHDSYPTWFPVADRKLLAKVEEGKGRGGGIGVPLASVGNGPITPHAVVAKDGSGKYKSVNDALKAYPPNHQGRYIIYVKAGIYQEQVRIDRKQPNVFIYGDGVGKTIITGNKNFKLMKYTIMDSATFGVDSVGFIAKGITFRNDAGPKGDQAVALRINGDRAAIFDCSIEGYQDTLYYQTGLQYYRNCVISGTIDFIFGKGTALIQNSVIMVRKPDVGQKNAITADGREIISEVTGVVLQNCRIIPDKDLIPEKLNIETYLTRPWKKFSTNVFMESEIGDFIRPEGYMKFEAQPPNYYEQTALCHEFANRGVGAATARRSTEFKMFRVLSPQEAINYTARVFLKGNEWLPGTSVPFYLGLGGK